MIDVAKKGISRGIGKAVAERFFGQQKPSIKGAFAKGIAQGVVEDISKYTLEKLKLI